MSPIYVRPAREQFEHDRLIQFLEAQHKGSFEVLTNKGESRDYALKIGEGTYFPDLILQDAKKLSGVIEIETGESTNNLEALAQWVHFGKAKAPFHLYVPVLMYDAARRFCELNQVTVTEIWTYRPTHEGFELFRVFHDPQAVAKSGKGQPAKVVVMPKTVQAPRIEPVAELIEEVVRLGQKAEAARAARREAMRTTKVAVVRAAAAAAKAAAPGKGAPPAKPAAPAKAAAPAPAPAAAPAPVAGKAEKVVAKPATKAAPPKAAPPKAAPKAAAKPAAKPAPKPAPKAAAKKAAVKPAAKPSPKAKAPVKAKPKAKPAPKAKAKPVSKSKPKVAPKAKTKAAKKKR